MMIRKLGGEQLSLLAAMKPFFPPRGHNFVDLCLGLFNFLGRQDHTRINPEAAVDFINVLNTQVEQRRQARLLAQESGGAEKIEEATANPYLLFLILILLIVSFDD